VIAPLLDSCFLSVDNTHMVRGEKMSRASEQRKEAETNHINKGKRMYMCVITRYLTANLEIFPVESAPISATESKIKKDTFKLLRGLKDMYMRDPQSKEVRRFRSFGDLCWCCKGTLVSLFFFYYSKRHLTSNIELQ